MRKIMLFISVVGLIVVTVLGFMATSEAVELSALDELEEHDTWLYVDYYKDKIQCGEEGCTNEISSAYQFTVRVTENRLKNLDIRNADGWTISQEQADNISSKTRYDKDKYLHLEEQADGSYNASIETKYNEYTVETVNHKKPLFVTIVTGGFCSEHDEGRFEAMRYELKQAIKRNPVCFLGRTIAPLLYAILLFVIGCSLVASKDATLSEINDAQFKQWLTISCVALAVGVLFAYVGQSMDKGGTFVTFVLGAIPLAGGALLGGALSRGFFLKKKAKRENQDNNCESEY